MSACPSSFLFSYFFMRENQNASTCQTNLSHSPLLLLATCHFCSIKICISKWSSKDDGHAAVGSCSSHLAPFCFTAAGKSFAWKFYQLKPCPWRHGHTSIKRYLNIITSLVFHKWKCFLYTSWCKILMDLVFVKLSCMNTSFKSGKPLCPNVPVVTRVCSQKRHSYTESNNAESCLF